MYKLVEKYYVDENFYYGYDFISKPDESKWKKELLTFEPFDITEHQLEELYRKQAPKET